MSSILNVLKKLESDQPWHHENESLSQRINTKRVINQRLKGPLLFIRLISILFAALILIVCGWFVISLKPGLIDRHSLVSNIQHLLKKEAKIVSSPANKIDTDAPPQTAKIEAVALKPLNFSEKKGPTPLLSPQANPGLKAVEKPMQSAIKREAPLVAKRPTSAKRTDRSRFRLQAIVWSNIAKSRFAVINGHIVRQGESIKGMSVTQISRDYVALQSDEEEWKLRLRRE